MEGPEIHSSEAVIDNGALRHPHHPLRDRPPRPQAAGSAVAYLDDDTMLLSATTAGKHPKDQFDFFPLTIDVEERMYAAGRIPGSFFRREGRPSEDAILTCRLIDRPLRPTFVKGLRNEVQVVITVMSLNPDAPLRRRRDQRRVDVDPARPACRSPARSAPSASPSSAASGSPSRPHEQLEEAVFDMVVAGRIAGDDVADHDGRGRGHRQHRSSSSPGGAKAPTEEVVAEGLEAAKPFIRILCEAQSELAAKAAKETAEFPVFPDYQPDALRRRRGRGHRRAGRTP